MNLADYLSELLGQREEVNLPGLGCFVRERVSGYYNDREQKFYPPYHRVKFVPVSEDDDTFAQYVAEKKNISLASSKYFAEKFISKLRDDAAKGSYPFADLGTFYTDEDQLVFKPNDKIASDPAFYGYPAINISKSAKPKHSEPIEPVFAKPVAQSEVTTAPVKTLRQMQQEQYFEEEEEYETKRSISIWWIILLAVTIITLGLFGVYEVDPSAFKAIYNKTFTKESAIVPPVRNAGKSDTLHSDTVIKSGTVTDTASKAVPAAVSGPVAKIADSTNVSHFDLIVAAFRTYPSATAEVDHYKAKGIKATIVTDAPGPLLKISVGIYPTYAKADSAKQILVKSGKIPKDSQPLEIKPRK